MPHQGQYSPELRELAVRRVFARQDENASQWEAIKLVARELGPTPETLQKWVLWTEIHGRVFPETAPGRSAEMQRLKWGSTTRWRLDEVR